MNEINIVSLLEGNDIPPDVIQNFITNGITTDLFYKLHSEHLKELCPHLGTRIKISEIITAYAPTDSFYMSTESSCETENESAKPTSTSVSAAHEENVLITRYFPDFDLHTLLQTTVGGNSILKYYETYKILNNSKRNQLTDIIIKHIYTYIVNHKITYEEYNILAAKILTIFPTESIGIYYTRSVPKGQSLTGRPVAARGKLVDKVRNLIFKYGERKRKSSVSDNEALAKRTQLTTSSNDEQASTNADYLWLKTNNEPFDEVVNKWKATFAYRKERAQYANVHDFFVEWPILNDPRSHTLINIDFELKYPDSGVKFFLNFNDFYNKILNIRNTKNEALLNIVQAINDLEEDRKIPAQIHIMTHLIPPKGRLNKNVKFSSQEAVDSIFLLVTNAGDIDSKIEKQKQKAVATKSPIQPYIILQGTLLNCSSPLLVIDNIKYSFHSISQAFDTLFKAFHVFDASYPRASNHIHLIIQRCVYRIQTKYDNVVPYIADILQL